MKINKLLKKYQATIQTFGIIIVLGALIMAYWQNSLLKDQLKLAKETKLKEDSPNINVIVDYSRTNKLSDKLIFKNKSNNVVLQKEEIIFVNKSIPISFNSYSHEFKTVQLKNELIKVINENYSSFDTDLGMIASMKTATYPIAIKYTFEYFGKIQDTVILYEYIYKVYFTDTKQKIKTLGVKFVKYLEDDKEGICNELIRYNLNNCLLSTLPNSNFVIKREIILDDSILSPFYRLIESNLSLLLKETVFIDSSYQLIQDSIPRHLFRYYPANTIEKKAINEKIEIKAEIDKKIKYADLDIKLSLQKVLLIEKKYENIDQFFDLDQKNDLNEIMLNDSVYYFEDEIEEWKIVNIDLLNLLYQKVKF